MQENDPSESVTFAKIDSLAISLPEKLQIKDESGTRNDFCLNGVYNLKFSDNLTCVIGGRGSGKSTLAHIIYSSWIDHDPKKLSSIGSPLLNLDLQPSPLKRVLEYTTCDVPVQTEFFFQNEIEHAAKNIESMSALIGTRLGRLSSIDAGETLDTLRETCDASSSLVDELIAAYDRITVIDAQILKAQENIATLKKQTEIIKSDEYKAFQEEIGKLTAKIADFKSYKIDYEILIKQIESLSASIVPLKWTDEQGREILEALHQSLDYHKQRIQKAFSVANANYSAQDYPTQLTKLQQDWVSILRLAVFPLRMSKSSHKRIQESKSLKRKSGRPVFRKPPTKNHTQPRLRHSIHTNCPMKPIRRDSLRSAHCCRQGSPVYPFQEKRPRSILRSTILDLKLI